MTLAAKSNIEFFVLIPNVRSNVSGMYQSAKFEKRENFGNRVPFITRYSL
jgi:hypothetical protein